MKTFFNLIILLLPILSFGQNIELKKFRCFADIAGGEGDEFDKREYEVKLSEDKKKLELHTSNNWILPNVKASDILYSWKLAKKSIISSMKENINGKDVTITDVTFFIKNPFSHDVIEERISIDIPGRIVPMQILKDFREIKDYRDTMFYKLKYCLVNL